MFVLLCVHSPTLFLVFDVVVIKGIGFVTYKAHESAVKAIEGMNGHRFKDRILTVEKRRDRDTQPPPYDERTVCIDKAPRVSRDEIQSMSPYLACFLLSGIDVPLSIAFILEHFENCGRVRAVDFTLGDNIYVTYDVTFPSFYPLHFPNPFLLQPFSVWCL